MKLQGKHDVSKATTRVSSTLKDDLKTFAEELWVSAPHKSRLQGLCKLIVEFGLALTLNTLTLTPKRQRDSLVITSPPVRAVPVRTCMVQGPASDVAFAILHTRFHAVPKLEIVAPLAAKLVAPHCMLHVTSPPLPPHETMLKHVRIHGLRPSVCSGVCSCCGSLPSGFRNAHKHSHLHSLRSAQRRFYFFFKLSTSTTSSIRHASCRISHGYCVTVVFR